MAPLQYALFTLAAASSLVAAASKPPTIGTNLFDLNRLVEDDTVSADADAPAWERWIEQPVDHDDRLNTQTFKQLYQYENKFQTQNKVAVIMESYYGDMSPVWLINNSTGISFYGKELGAAMFSFEHRFYGRSLPFGKNPPKDKLKYHTSEQNLKDLANFMEFARTKEAGFGLDANAKFVFVGGSYMGMTSAWMRLKYPHLVAAAVASSPPVQAKRNFYEYAEVVTYALGNTKNGTECLRTVRDGLKEMEASLRDESKRQNVAKAFGLCRGFEGQIFDKDGKFTQQIMDIPAYVYSAFQGVVQYSIDTALGWTNRKACDFVVDTKNGATDMERLAAFMRTNFGWFPNAADATCWDIAPAAYKYSGSAGDLWHWQTCNEFGFQQTIDPSPKNAFSFANQPTSPWRADECFAKFGVASVDANVRETNVKYGGWNIKSKGIFFVDGDEDPWKALSLQDPSAAAENDNVQPHVNIKGASHCLDLSSIKAHYMPEFAKSINDTRAKVLLRLKEWVRDGQVCKSTKSHISHGWCQSVNGCVAYPSICQLV